MRHNELVPPIVQQVPGISDDVLIRAILGRKQVARPCVVALSGEGPPHGAGKFAGDEDAAHQSALCSGVSGGRWSRLASCSSKVCNIADSNMVAVKGSPLASQR